MCSDIVCLRCMVSDGNWCGGIVEGALYHGMLCGAVHARRSATCFHDCASIGDGRTAALRSCKLRLVSWSKDILCFGESRRNEMSPLTHGLDGHEQEELVTSFTSYLFHSVPAFSLQSTRPLPTSRLLLSSFRAYFAPYLRPANYQTSSHLVSVITLTMAVLFPIIALIALLCSNSTSAYFGNFELSKLIVSSPFQAEPTLTGHSFVQCKLMFTLITSIR
jgi:hypothetical protein